MRYFYIKKDIEYAPNMRENNDCDTEADACCLGTIFAMDYTIN